jgi:ribose transport system permease protein
MGTFGLGGLLGRLLSDYGMALVLLLLCGLFSALTLAEQDPEGSAGGEQLASLVARRVPRGGRVLIVVGASRQDEEFAAVLHRRLDAAGIEVVGDVCHSPSAARDALAELSPSRQRLDAIAATPSSERWPVLQEAGVPVLAPERYRWPNFLKADNLLNIANQIAVIAILAVGMTFVIVTGNIDLSVGSLVALSAVLATGLIRGWAGSYSAGPGGMLLCCLAAIALCGAFGLVNGAAVAGCGVQPFISTLAMMLVARGLAQRLSEGQSIFEVPASFGWLGLGADLYGIPNGVVLMLLLYLAAHVVLSRTVFGRYVYAVGGNREAARLSGVPVGAVILVVYGLSGALAGLGGVVLASQLKSGSHTYGLMYELDAIAAVAVGGASLSGGEGKVFGTLIGAFIIAVIHNGMNLVGLRSEWQQVVLGLVIFGAVLLDRFKKHVWAAGRAA